MEEGRVFPISKKPRVVLDKRFPFINSLKVGDKGQLDTQLEVESMALEPDENADEFKVAKVIVREAETIERGFSA